MKQGMMVIAMCVVLSFLVSLSAVSVSVAKQVTHTTPTPTTKQQGPLPISQPKSAFWDLEPGSIFVKGQVIKYGGGNHTINVKVGETVTFKCTYRMKTIPVGDITLADAKYWGSGSIQFTNCLRVWFPVVGKEAKIFCKDKSLPKFTYEDVKNWHLQPTVGKAWDEEVVFQWTPASGDAGIPYISVLYNLDYNHTINETNEQNNGINTAGGLLTIVVTP